MTPEYLAKLEVGLEYQDFIAEKLYEEGIPLVGFFSKKYQLKYGENTSGIEIKHDRKVADTGNLYIEVAEKKDASNPDWAKSGILREDNAWLLLIGNYDTAWLFALQALRQAYQPEDFLGMRRVVTDTSVGYLMPVALADQVCIRRFEWGNA